METFTILGRIQNRAETHENTKKHADILRNESTRKYNNALQHAQEGTETQ